MASANAHKAIEIAEILTDHDIEPRPTGMGEVVESEKTLEGNARLRPKRSALQLAPPPLPTTQALRLTL